MSGDGEIGRHVAALGRGAARRCVVCAAAWSRWSTPRMRPRRVGSRMDTGTTVIREEGESGDFFYFRADGSVACWAVLASRPTNVCPDKTDFLATALSFINIYNYIYIQLLKYKSECIRCRSLSLIPVL